MAGEKTYIDTSQKGAPNGVASLDINGEVPETHIPVTANIKKYIRKWTNIMKYK